MRSYIFTPLEREKITAYLEGRIDTGDSTIRKLRFRVKNFKNLASDVELYLRFREAVTAKPA